jgi:hypothetical protein
LEGLAEDGRIILKWILVRKLVDWIHPAQDRVPVSVLTGMRLSVSIKSWEFVEYLSNYQFFK